MVLIGAGQRGMIYANNAYQSGLADIVAVAEPDAGRRKAAQQAFQISDHLAFDNAQALLAQKRLGEAVIIASMDRDHFAQAMPAMDAGYDILLEKPISPFPAECLRIQHKAQQTGRRVIVCHVLRYSPFFREVHHIIQSGQYGRVVAIQHNENIGNFHMAHAFVRGNWRNSKTSSPIIMQKSCHDMDLLYWYAGSPAKRIASFGNLYYFRPENAPAGSAMRCLDCAVSAQCRFDARKAYLPVMGDWPATVLTQDQTEQGLLQAMREGPYGRCVYRCDNDVCDHQATSIEFENGVTATFNLSAFTNRMTRTMKIMLEDAEIRASEHENVIQISSFASTGEGRAYERVIHPPRIASGHSGGDQGLIHDFLEMLESGTQTPDTAIQGSVESHLMAGAAELARVQSRVVDMQAYRSALQEETS